MMLDPYTLDRIVERDPWEATRDRYVELASEDRPGSPYEFDAREAHRPWSWWIITGAQLVAVSLPVLALWVLFGSPRPAALIAIPLWTAAGVFAAVVIARVIRDVARTEDPENPYDV